MGTAKPRQVGIWFYPEEFEKLNALAARTRRTKSAVVKLLMDLAEVRDDLDIALTCAGERIEQESTVGAAEAEKAGT
jgi:predicted DNA-binding protein